MQKNLLKSFHWQKSARPEPASHGFGARVGAVTDESPDALERLTERKLKRIRLGFPSLQTSRCLLSGRPHYVHLNPRAPSPTHQRGEMGSLGVQDAAELLAGGEELCFNVWNAPGHGIQFGECAQLVPRCEFTCKICQKVLPRGLPFAFGLIERVVQLIADGRKPDDEPTVLFHCRNVRGRTLWILAQEVLQCGQGRWPILLEGSAKRGNFLSNFLSPAVGDIKKIPPVSH